jgi:hypothetical protein
MLLYSLTYADDPNPFSCGDVRKPVTESNLSLRAARAKTRLMHADGERQTGR